MMLRSASVVFLLLIVVAHGLRIYRPSKRCSRSFDCPEGQCCRDRRGNLIGEQSWFGVDISLDGSGPVGYCSRRSSGPGKTCNRKCGCTRGHTCYRTITGACCPPRTCWTEEAARKDRAKWNNCLPPNCFFPPVAAV